MYLCMWDCLALLMIMFPPIPLNIPMFLPFVHNLHFLEYTIDAPIDNFDICNSNVDIDYADNTFHMLGGNVENFGSLGYFSGYDAALDPYCINLWDKPRKILWNTFFAFSFDFSMALTLRGLILFFVLILMFSHSHACEPHAVRSISF